MLEALAAKLDCPPWIAAASMANLVDRGLIAATDDRTAAEAAAELRQAAAELQAARALVAA